MNTILKSIAFPAEELLVTTFPAWECHVHTSYTDGTNTIDEIVKHAVQTGIEKLVFTEHTEPWHAHREDWFKLYCEDIDRLRQQLGDQIELIIGIEAPALTFDGELDCTPEMLLTADFILGAAHRYPGLGSRKVSELEPEEALELEFKTLMALCQIPEVDAIAHIGATCMKYCGPFPEEQSRAIVKEATRAGKAIEINHAYHKPLDKYIQICIEEQAIITAGSNAHNLSALGKVATAIQDWQNEHNK